MPSLVGCVALLLLAIALSTQALSLGEEDALLAILEANPHLAKAPQPWQRNVSLACTPPVFYGIQCSNDSEVHIQGLYVSKTYFLA